MRAFLLAKVHYLWTSTGKKFLMAFTGVGLIIFIIDHLLGNLQIFLGQEAINRYAAFLRSTGELLWVVRFGLIGIACVHITTAVSLTLENRGARPVPYVKKGYLVASLPSRAMVVTGLMLLSFLLFHLSQFNWHLIHPEYTNLVDPKGRPDVYSMTVLFFLNPWCDLLYLIGVFLLGMHLSHGIYSMVQSLGLIRETFRPLLRIFSTLVGYGIFVGYAIIPIGVLLRWVHLPPGVPWP